MALAYQYTHNAFRQLTVAADAAWSDAAQQTIKAYATPISDPDSAEFKAFYQGLVGELNGQVEAFEVLVREMQDPSFIFIAVTDGPISKRQPPKLLSAAYASLVELDNKETMLAVRFAFTVEEARGSGVSLVTYDRLIIEAQRLANLKAHTLTSTIGEAVDSSERFLNKVELAPGYNRKRMYVELLDGNYEEFRYALPPLEWNRDGTPKTAAINEHLMFAHTESSSEVSVPMFVDSVRSWWNQWYLRPREDFESEQAWALHKDLLNQFFERTIVEPLKNVNKLILLSANEREILRLEGKSVLDFNLTP